MSDVPPPQFCPSPRELDDLELLSSGVFGEQPRFDPDGGAVTLHLPARVASQAEAAGSVVLTDPEGVPLAQVGIEATYPAGGELTGVVGRVVPLQHPEHGPFRRLRLTPEQTLAQHSPDTVTVPLSGPLSMNDFERLWMLGAPVLLLALTGHGTPSYAGRRLSPDGLVRATLAAGALGDRVSVVVVPLASRGPGREAEDRELRNRVVAAYAPGPVFQPSGDGPLPAELRAVLEREVPPPDEQGLVVFFTGLSGSGKSTLARSLMDVVLEEGVRTVTSLDGDVVRRNLSAGLTFSKADRETNIRRIGWVAAEIARHGGMAVCSPIAPFDATRKQVRQLVEDAGGAFFLVHVATPVEECERRDRKGLYAKARRGEIPEFTGVSSPYEEPDDADLRVDTTGRSVDEVLQELLTALRSEGRLP